MLAIPGLWGTVCTLRHNHGARLERFQHSIYEQHLCCYKHRAVDLGADWTNNTHGTTATNSPCRRARAQTLGQWRSSACLDGWRGLNTNKRLGFNRCCTKIHALATPPLPVCHMSRCVTWAGVSHEIHTSMAVEGFFTRGVHWGIFSNFL